MSLVNGKCSYIIGKEVNPQDISLTVGDFTSIAEGLKLVGGKHPSVVNKNCVTNFGFRRVLGFDNFPVEPYINREIIVGNDVWIGAHVILFEGVTIGDGAIVGSGALVNKDVEPYSVVGGVPAKLIRKRFDDVIITKLLQIRWWEWNKLKIKENMWLMDNVDEFVRVHFDNYGR